MATFIPPADDPVVEEAQGFLPPADDPIVESAQGFTPPDDDPVITPDLERFRTADPGELSTDYNGFNPLVFFNEHEGALSPDEVEKLALAYQLRRDAGFTPGAVATGVKNAGVGLIHFLKGAKDVAVATMPQDFAREVERRRDTGEGLVESTYKTGKKKIGEAIAGTDLMATATGNLVRTGVRKMANRPLLANPATSLLHDFSGRPDVQGDLSDLKNFFQAEDEVKRLFADAAVLKQQQTIAEGQGFYSEFLGQDAESLAKSGIVMDPAVIEGWSQVSDPTLWAPFLAGLTVAKMGGKFAVMSGTRPVATATTEGAARDFVKKLTTKVETFAKGADDVAKRQSPNLGTTIPIAAFGAALGHPWMATILGTKLAARGAAKGVGAAARVAGSKSVWDLGAGATKGAAIGAASSLPFAAAMDLPEEQTMMLGIGTLMGAGGGGLQGASTAVRRGAYRAGQLADSALWKNQDVSAPTRDTVLSEAGLEALEAHHAEVLPTLKELNPSAANWINRARAALGAERAAGSDTPPVIGTLPRTPSYLMTPEFAAQANPALEGKRGANRISVTDAQGNPREIMAWILDEGSMEALTHEPGHFLVDNFLQPDQREALLATIPDDVRRQVHQEYIARWPESERSRVAANRKRLDDEVLAEVLGQHLEGRKLDGLPLNTREKIALAARSMLESLGLYETGLDTPGTPGASRGFGVRSDSKTSQIADQVVNQWLQDPDVTAAMAEFDKPPIISPEAAPDTVPGVASPAEPKRSPVTPEHEVVLEGIRKSMPGGTYNKLATIADKLRRGESLTTVERRLWSGVEESAGVKSEIPDAVVPEPPAAPQQPEPKIIFSDTDPEGGLVRPAPKSRQLDFSLEGQPEEGLLTTGSLDLTKPDAEPVIKPAPPVVDVPPSLRTRPKDFDKFTGAAREQATSRVQPALEAVRNSADMTPDQKQAVEQLLTNLRTPHDVVYNSAKVEGGTGRTPRRADIEAARGNPDLREAASKLASIPLDARVIKNGDAQVQFWSGDKVLANVEEAVTQIAGKGLEKEIPYPVKSGKLTSEGAAQLASDLQKYASNQDNGYRGDGQKLNRPDDFAGFIPDENPDYTPQPLSSPKAMEFLNLLMGERPPKSTRQTAGVVPIQARAKQLAGANQRQGVVIQPAKRYKAPYEDVVLSDYNPLRKRLQDAGVDLSQLTEAHEWVNAKEIQSATPRPDIELSPTTADVTAAGFLPAKTSVQITGPDGTQYPAIFDGYFDMRAIGKGLVPQFSLPEGAPGFPKRTTTYAPSLEAKGYKLPKLDEPDFLPERASEADQLAAAQRDADLEAAFARDFLGGKKQLTEFPYYEGYVSTIESEAGLLGTAPERMLFVGSGPVPLSAMLFKKRFPNAKIDVMDINSQSLNTGVDVAKQAGVNFDQAILADASSMPQLSGYDTVVVALEAGPTDTSKSGVVRNVLDNVPADARVLLRGTASRGGESFASLPDGLNVQERVPTFDGYGETVLVSPDGGGTAPRLAEFKSPRTLEAALQKPGWAVVTATRESIGDGLHPKNVAANEKLAAQLKAEGRRFVPVQGFYRGVDQGKSFLVTDITPEQALEIGKQWQQESVLVPEGLLYGDDTVNPVRPEDNIVGDVATTQDFYSQVEDGPAFTMGIDFEQRVPRAKGDEASFMPTLDQLERKWAKQDAQKSKPKTRTSSAADPTAWVLPDGVVKSLTGAFHERDLAANFQNYNKKFGTKFTRNADVEDRLAALNSGFVRVRFEPRSSQFIVEANAKHWEKRKAGVLEHALQYEDRIDRLRVTLLDDDGNVVDSSANTVFDAEVPEAAIRSVFKSVKSPTAARGTKGPSAIQRARELGGDFLPAREVDRAAIQLPDGRVFTGRAHFEALMDALNADVGAEALKAAADGFVTKDGEFLTRRQAYERATESGQMDADTYDAVRPAEDFRTVGKRELESQAFDASRKDGSLYDEGAEFLPAKFWLEPDGEVRRVDRAHVEQAAKELGIKKVTEDNWVEVVEKKIAKGAVRGNVDGDTLFLDGMKERFADLPRSARNAIEDIAIGKGLAVNYNGRFIDDFGAQFLPEKAGRAPRKTTLNKLKDVDIRPLAFKVRKEYGREITQLSNGELNIVIRADRSR